MESQWAQKQQCLLQISVWRRLKTLIYSNKAIPSQENGSVLLVMFSPFGTATEKKRIFLFLIFIFKFHLTVKFMAEI